MAARPLTIARVSWRRGVVMNRCPQIVCEVSDLGNKRASPALVLPDSATPLHRRQARTTRDALHAGGRRTRQRRRGTRCEGGKLEGQQQERGQHRYDSGIGPLDVLSAQRITKRPTQPEEYRPCNGGLAYLTGIEDGNCFQRRSGQCQAI
jgi:hypothetical protein